ncbi:MAG: hypothetical protein K2O18_10895 [Oscillospiraceae bacterium]|nr:hypothetical protein [Oscillospiraceae bacterium]
MLWFWTIIFGGCMAAVFFMLSVWLIRSGKRAAGFAFAALELLAAAVSSASWMWALKVSGKMDWFLFGLFGYTPFALIFYAMFAVGIGCIVMNVRSLRRERNLKNDS